MSRQSPIDALIGKACGLPDDYAPPETIVIHCTGCGRSTKVPVDKSDPPGTVTANILCPECVAGDFDLPQYFDAEGNELDAAFDQHPILGDRDV